MSNVSATSPADASLDRGAPLLSLTRGIVVVIFLLSVANGVFLYFFPDRADTDYAWPIRPEVNAAFKGAGYLSGAFVAGAVLVLRASWRSVRLLIPGVAALATLMFVATLIYRDRFDWDYPLTWVWAAVYAAIPPAAAAVWYVQERKAPSPAADARLRIVRLLVGLASAPVIVLALALFLFPDDMLAHTPWQMSPLLARVDAGWYALLGGMLLATAALARRPHELVIPFFSPVSWAALTLLLPLRYADDMRTERAEFWLWFALQAIALLGGLVIGLWALRVTRVEGQRL